MARIKIKRPPKIKIKHSRSARPSAAKVRDKVRMRALGAAHDDASTADQPVWTAGDDLRATRILLRLRGEELVRLHMRVDRMEAGMAKRATTQEQATSDMRAALRARDAETRALSELVCRLESRIAAMEASIFEVAGKAMENLIDLEQSIIRDDHARASLRGTGGTGADPAHPSGCTDDPYAVITAAPTGAPAPVVAPEGCIPDTNDVGTAIQAAEPAAAEGSADESDESRVDVTVTPDNA